MFNAIGFILKVVIFSIIVLVVGNYATWEGKTVSDQIKTHLSHAERSEIADQVRDLTQKITADAKEGFERKNDKPRSKAAPAEPRGKIVSQNDKSASEEIAPSERQKLRALIRELNSAQKKN